MGEWRKPVCCKLNDEERGRLLAIHDALAPIHEENLSLTLRWCVRAVHNLISIEGNLDLLLKITQGSQWTTAYHTDKQSEFQFAQEKRPLLRFMHAANERRQA